MRMGRTHILAGRFLAVAVATSFVSSQQGCSLSEIGAAAGGVGAGFLLKGIIDSIGKDKAAKGVTVSVGRQATFRNTYTGEVRSPDGFVLGTFSIPEDAQIPGTFTVFPTGWGEVAVLHKTRDGREFEFFMHVTEAKKWCNELIVNGFITSQHPVFDILQEEEEVLFGMNIGPIPQEAIAYKI